MLLILNGASCAGKTTLASVSSARYPAAHWLHPDGTWDDTPHITPESLLRRVLASERDFGSGLTLVDMQIAPSSLVAELEGFQHDWSAVLLDCSDAAREARMTERGGAPKTSRRWPLGVKFCATKRARSGL